MDSRGSDAGAPDGAPVDDAASARSGEDAGPVDAAPAAGTPRSDRDEAAAGAAGRAASVAVDPWPDADSLPWASDGPATAPPARRAPGGVSPPTGDETTEIISPDQIVPPPHQGVGEAQPGWAPPAGPPNGPSSGPWGPRAGVLDDPSPGGSWAPPAGPPHGPASVRGTGMARHRAGAPPAGGPAGRSGPGLAGLLGGLAQQVKGRERVVLAVAGVVFLVVAIAVVALGGDDGDGDGGGAEAVAPATTAPIATGDGTDPTGPFVGPSGIVGWWSGTAWVPRPEGEAPDGGVVLTVVGMSGEARTAEGETVPEDCAAQEGTAGADVAVDLGGDGGAPPPIGVAGVAEPQPRPVETFSSPAPTYLQAAAEVARQLGAGTPPTVTQVVRSDLDGSGTFEVVVAAEHVADPGRPAAGDWSVVFLRRVVGNEVATHVLASSSVDAGGGPAGFDRIRLSALADLNADGQMELVLDGRSADGRWTAIHELGADGTPAEVLRDGCDA
jgi:hypothetical protein